ncbi:hypothetical protein HFO05_07125 [Rhizobium laguerreae]|uniref:hypothetical protein n=1 Tax=Rhizobium laguerreae TaxID=1076926 RepID=UPI001C91B36C|nr:hypothetical protein [Rhizobium laguerreae]MBY3268383.1 hypothetical protein [Rhizobium laguerreae]
MREQPISEAVENDERAKVIAYHRGDTHAAIDTLLEDIRHLRRQLALAEGAMSRGMTRGWLPDYDGR